MKKNILIALTFSPMGIIAVQSCKKEKLGSDGQGEGEIKTSSHGTSESHNMGQNCMNCHKSGGPGEGIFAVAVTVYDSLKTNVYPNATIKLYTLPDGSGQLRATVFVDGKGNFYTTAAVDFSGGLYPSVTGASGITKYMPISISIGACNSCHGVSADKIWIN